ncbi:hypothetical protein SAMN05421752_11373 [Natronorubrum thiooxidans]|uniref:Uncharacterized protein n=1 Tax=Natronorubrum thiooxidans TaxID=308853 RepID=A0A1N7GM16_9EURY|nr:hypothetical protein SAMN05421752_11373 [Natronorubrum thiooxidans]
MSHPTRIYTDRRRSPQIFVAILTHCPVDGGLRVSLSDHAHESRDGDSIPE